MLAARRLAFLVGALAVFTLPAAVGAASPAGGVAELRERATTLAERERAATLELYALESRLTRTRSQLAALSAEREAAETRLARIRIRLDTAWQSSFVAERHLGARIRQLYETGGVDPVAVLLGAQSLDEAIGGLDGLRSVAAGDAQILEQVRRARAELSQAKRQAAARADALQAAEAAAYVTAVQLETAASERREYIARLASDRGFTARRIARARRTARTAERRSEATAPVPPVLETTLSAPVPSAETASGERTLTVEASGYAIRGRTATGLPTAWGVVAVDPSVIPLGTKLTIPGYGQGVAADTGGAVRGAKIDLWFPSLAQALAWGRRTVTITIHG
jgi:3D (Asp-Asp-Asp) domain-containing protein/predicted  nucleic acid-binding Zn-ribbon protein